ncbi:AtpZ/AtpI family protein [Rubripirellula lacrimiformis]|nr:AtpZ/AtpI family protein [Rubripirellula lacrimiformis]
MTLTDDDGTSQSPPNEQPSQAGGSNGTNDRDGSKAWMKFAGLGIELAGTTLGFAAIGYAVDWALGSQRPLGTAAGVLIGFSFAMFRFIKIASGGNPTDSTKHH